MFRFIRRAAARTAQFVRDLKAGYEPVQARAGLSALFILLAACGIGSGKLPPQVDAGLAFIAVVSPIIAGWKARAKVSPVHNIRDRNRPGE